MSLVLPLRRSILNSRFKSSHIYSKSYRKANDFKLNRDGVCIVVGFNFPFLNYILISHMIKILSLTVDSWISLREQDSVSESFIDYQYFWICVPLSWFPRFLKSDVGYYWSFTVQFWTHFLFVFDTCRPFNCLISFPLLLLGLP